MKQFFLILLCLAGFLSLPAFAEMKMPAGGDQISADADPKPDEEEEEPDCD
jgi:hypothetical protein